MIEPMAFPFRRADALRSIRTLARDLTGRVVTDIQTPQRRTGGALRLSLEDGRSVLAIRRETQARVRQEVALLTALRAENAPVPEVIGFQEAVILLADPGGRRLSECLASASDTAALRLTRSSLSALGRCRDAAHRRSGMFARLPQIGHSIAWVEQWVAATVFLSGDLGLHLPQLEFEAVADALMAPGRRLTMWSATFEDALVTADGEVVWCNWASFGRRAGVEDISWLLTDRHWRPDAAETDGLLRVMTDEEARRVRRTAVFVAVNRLSELHSRMVQQATPIVWSEADVKRLAARMAEFCADDPLVRDLVPWFENVAEALAHALSVSTQVGSVAPKADRPIAFAREAHPVPGPLGK